MFVPTPCPMRLNQSPRVKQVNTKSKPDRWISFMHDSYESNYGCSIYPDGKINTTSKTSAPINPEPRACNQDVEQVSNLHHIVSSSRNVYALMIEYTMLRSHYGLCFYIVHSSMNRWSLIFCRLSSSQNRVSFPGKDAMACTKREIRDSTSKIEIKHIHH